MFINLIMSLFQATRYNYNSGEKLAIIELISMIKDTQQLLLSMVTQLQLTINQYMYQQLQRFMQVQLREPLRKSIKHKKTALRS